MQKTTGPISGMFLKTIRAVTEKMEALLPERSSGIPDTYLHSNMPVLEIDGVDYVTLLEIPSLQVSLPVADQWDGEKLVYSPARFTGSVYDRTMVIGGRSEPHQFAFCSKIENGTLITVTDMTGTQFTYKVTTVDRAAKAERKWLADPDHPLTLYCQDSFSMEYIAVRCDLAYG